MQTIRISNRTAPRQIYRVVKPTTTATTNPQARTMAFFPSVFQNDLAPVFRLMDDYANHIATRDPFTQNSAPSLRTSFSPRFDFQESKDAYELHGELPGVKQKDLEIEFTDAQTMSIRGRSERVREEGTRPAAIEAAQVTTQKQITERRDSHSSGSYQKPSVEDEDGVVVEGGDSNAEPQAQNQTHEVEKQRAETEGPKYWISERSVGSFARSFSFPQRVDQDAVKASLKNGILSIIVPKAAPASRRITVE